MKYFFLFLLGFFFFNLSAQDITVYEKKGKYGLKRAEKVIAKPIYTEIKDFSEGLVACKKGKKWGFMNEKGEVVIKCKYDYVKDFSRGLAAVGNNSERSFFWELLTDGLLDAIIYKSSSHPDLWGFINKEGKIVIELKYNEPKSFQNELNVLKYSVLPTHTHVFNTQGEKVFESVEWITSMTENCYLVKGENGYAYIDENGKQLSEWLYQAAYKDSSRSIAIRYSDRKQALFDYTGKRYTDWYAKILEYKNGFAIFEEDFNKVGVVDSNGNVVIQPVYSGARFSDDVLLVTKEWKGMEWIILADGKELTGPFKIKSEFRNGIAVAAIPDQNKIGDGDIVFIDERGNYISEIFDDIGYFSTTIKNGGNYTYVNKYVNGDFYYAYVDRSGKPISSWYKCVEEYLIPSSAYSGGGSNDKVSETITNIIKTLTSYYVIDIFKDVFKGLFKKHSGGDGCNCRYVYYHHGAEFSNNRALISLPGKHEQLKIKEGTFISDHAKFGYIDTLGKEVIPIKFDRAGDFRDGEAIVGMNGKFGSIDVNGYEKVPIVYDELGDLLYKRRRFRKGELWGYLDESGKEVIPAIYSKAENFSYAHEAKVELGMEKLYINLDGKVIRKQDVDY